MQLCLAFCSFIIFVIILVFVPLCNSVTNQTVTPGSTNCVTAFRFNCWSKVKVKMLAFNQVIELRRVDVHYCMKISPVVVTNYRQFNRPENKKMGETLCSSVNQI